jgi:hypothetical protein
MMRMDMADQERRAQAQMEAVFADTGSAIQYMAAADEANQQLMNVQTRYRTEQMNQNLELQSQALENKMKQYSDMVQQGTMSAIQYMDMRQRGYESLLTGYLNQAQLELQSLTGALAGEQGLAGLKMEESAQDLAALNSQFESVYNSMMAQTGINSSILQTLNQAYETTMAPMMDALNTLLAKENLSAQDAAYALELQALAIDQQLADTEDKWGWTSIIPDFSIGI